MKHEVQALYFPPSSSWLNSCEWIFAHLKRKIRLHFANLPEDVPTQKKFEDHVKVVLADFEKATHNSRLFHANMREVQRTFNEMEKEE